jgi:uncharacterized protein
MDFGWWGDRDITAAVAYLARQPGVRPGKIAVLGLSMGGEQAIAALGADPRIRAVVAEGVTGLQLADHGWLPHGIDGALTRGQEWVMYTAAALLSAAPRPVPPDHPAPGMEAQVSSFLTAPLNPGTMPAQGAGNHG